MDVVVEGQAYLKSGLIKCCIGIDDGKISAIKKIIKGDRHFDYGDKLILPGAIDSHVHFRDPGLTHKEDFETGSLAAAFGGVCCVIDMPNTIPQTITLETLKDKIAIATRKSFVDFGLFAGVNERSDIDVLSEHATALKIYLASTTGDMNIPEYDSLPSIFKKIEKTGKTVSVHCEDDALIDGNIKPSSLNDHLRSRPKQSEVSGIKRAISTAGNAKLHLCHISSKESVDLIKRLKSPVKKREEPTESGHKATVSKPLFTSEVTPHHLFLNSDSELGAYGKVNPPLRGLNDQNALWTALREGMIDTMASDHAPHTVEEKESFQRAPSGLPGVETMVPLMLSQVKHGKFDLHRLISAVSVKPAHLFGLNKGILEEGQDGDLIVVDMREERMIKGKELHSKCGWTPFEGFDGVFPRSTFVRGDAVIKDWSVEGESGFGQYAIPRESNKTKRY